MNIEKLYKQTLRGRKMHQDINFANEQLNLQLQKDQDSDACFKSFLRLTELSANLASLVGRGRTDVCSLDPGEDYIMETGEYRGLAKKLYEHYKELGLGVSLEPLDGKLMMVVEWAPNSSCSH